MSDKVKVGIIGCGAISQAYFNGASVFDILEIAACADLNMDTAIAKAEENGTKAVEIDALLSDPSIEIVLNLTVPKAHAEVDRKILEAGKHAYSEKPLDINFVAGQEVVKLAKEKKLLVGCAPDTFLGAGHQTCRKLIDDGWIGKPIAGTAFMMCHGHESWHPNPGFYYQVGGGPLFDMGPYYLTAMVNMLGPVKKVSAMTARSFDERRATCEARNGEIIPVEVNTHTAGTLEFQCGAIITAIMSFDVWKHRLPRIEIYGTEGSLSVPDPNGFGGEVNVFRGGYQEWSAVGHSHIYAENTRGIGAADMAYSIRSGRKHRCNGDLALHVLEVMSAFDKSSETGSVVEISSQCERPAPLPLGLVKGQLDA